MRKTDQWSGFVLLFFALAFFWSSAQLTYGSVRSPGPGFLPLWLGVLLAVLSLGLIVTTSLRKDRTKTIQDILAEKIRWRKLVIVLLALFLFGFSIEYLGFPIITFLFLGCLLLFVDRQSIGKVIGWALVGSIGSYILFEVLLKLRFPKGFFGI